MDLKKMAKVFSDRQALSDQSDLSLTVNKEVDEDGHQLIVELTCRDGVATSRMVHGYGSGEDEDGGELELEDYLKLWQDVVKSGFPDFAMTGKSLAPGTDYYLAGHAGPEGLGWVVSSTAAGIAQHAAAKALCEALIAFAEERSQLFEDNAAEFLTPA
jgi:hypothetical protein